MNKLNWEKGKGMLPAIVQDANSQAVIMLGYMNAQALQKTIDSGLVTFFSRTRNKLWQKGETSGNALQVVSIEADCDQDTLLVQAIPNGPICHRGNERCFDQPHPSVCASGFLLTLEQIVKKRRSADPAESYTAALFASGIDRIAQKVGEEAIEVVIASKNDDDQDFLGEYADLLYHLTVLLSQKGLGWSQVEQTLIGRQRYQSEKAE